MFFAPIFPLNQKGNFLTVLVADFFALMENTDSRSMVIGCINNRVGMIQAHSNAAENTPI
ncbi:hypothetical protein [Mesorhizobium sp. L2C066B000]|uniref:hypothetical protein n=1 Tax=Mesorhizobium sp. L2C066B000 TaxID=1287105 RepID=UPI0012DEF01D|nr:hypothetical protein [Mesorhizobium sp. L2C066B000]